MQNKIAKVLFICSLLSVLFYRESILYAKILHNNNIANTQSKTLIVIDHTITGISKQELLNEFNDCKLPPEKTVFLDTDSVVSSWVSYINATVNSTITWEWHPPNNESSMVQTTVINYADACHMAILNIGAGKLRSEYSGEWMVDVSVNNILLFTEHFTIINTSELKADFSAEPVSGTVPLKVHFTDQSTGNIDTWQWDFGDGKISNKQNPIHTYIKADTFTVNLTVNGFNGSDNETKLDFVKVKEPPDPILDSQNLLEKFAPILYINSDDFYPTSIFAILENSVLYTEYRLKLLGRLERDKVKFPSVDNLMDNNNSNAFLDFNKAKPGSRRITSTVPRRTDPDQYIPTVYGRKIETQNPASTILQYWFCYIYNNYTDFKLAKTRIQRHEGDWEMIQIVLTVQGTPAMAIYSYHHGGKKHFWNELEFDNTVDPKNTHPKVFVAHGGHGSWNTAGKHKWKQKIMGSCNFGEFADITLDNDYVLYPSNIAVNNTYNLIDITKVSKLDTHWTHWLGRWGEIKANTNEDINKLLGYAGPNSPAIIQYGDAPNRWTNPIDWSIDPNPSNYKECLDNDN